MTYDAAIRSRLRKHWSANQGWSGMHGVSTVPSAYFGFTEFLRPYLIGAPGPNFCSLRVYL